MRPFCLSYCCLLMLLLPAGAAHAGADAVALAFAGRAIAPACNIAATDPGASGEPPAWLLLASAVALLAAGRLAGRR